MTFSVVIPVYNGEAHLADALRCLTAQDFTDWEAVVVDDGSTDGTARVAADFAVRDPRIRLIRQENAGVSVARNRGADAARGDWIVWLDADDAYVPGALSVLAATAAAHPSCTCLQFPYREIVPGGADVPRGSPAYARFGGTEHPGPAAFDLLFARRDTGGQNWQPWRFVFRRAAMPRFRAGRIHEDVDVLPLALAAQPRVYLAQDALYRYRPARAGAATAAFTPRRVRDILEVTGHVYGDLARAALPARMTRGFRALLAFNLFGYYLATPGFDEPARTELLAAFAAHRAWLTAIDRPVRTAWLKRLLLRTLGVRTTARLVHRLASRGAAEEAPA